MKRAQTARKNIKEENEMKVLFATKKTIPNFFIKKIKKKFFIVKY